MRLERIFVLGLRETHVAVAAFWRARAVSCGFGWRDGESFVRALLPNLEFEGVDITHVTVSWLGLYFRWSKQSHTH